MNEPIATQPETPPELLEALKKWSREGVMTFVPIISRKYLLEIAAKAKYSSVSELLENAEKLERWVRG